MITWLHSLPNLGISLLFGSMTVLVCILLPSVIRIRNKWEVTADVSKGAEEAFKLTASMTMALLAFSLVQVQGFHRNAEDLAAREATIILKANKNLTALGPMADGVRADLGRYARSVIGDEWPLMAHGQRSPITTRLLSGLQHDFGDLKSDAPEMQVALAEAHGALTQASDVREARLAATQLALPSYFWSAIATVVTIVIVIGWFQGPLPKMIAYVGAVTLAISMLLSLLIVASGIYVGESRVQPTALERVLPLLDPGPSPGAAG